MLSDRVARPRGTADARPERFRRHFPADPNAVRDALRRAVARFARQITPEDAGTLELTLAEALNNVVEHGYAGLPPGLICLSIAREGNRLTCSIVDAGNPMPGLVLPEAFAPETPADIAELPEGGWGWPLIRGLTDGLDYCRDSGRNILTFTVAITPLCRPSESVRR